MVRKERVVRGDSVIVRREEENIGRRGNTVQEFLGY